GISTIGLTTVGVGVNVALASKKEEVAGKLESAREELKKIDEDANPGEQTAFAVASVVDAGDVSAEWTYEETEKCRNEIWLGVTSGWSVGKAYWSKSLNGKYCDGDGARNSFHHKKNPNTCPQAGYTSLSAGKWKTILKSGKSVYGTAMCSTTVGSEKHEFRDDIDTSGDGLNCWCKLEKSELRACLLHPKYPWMFANTETISTAEDEQDWEDYKDADYMSLGPRESAKAGENGCIWNCAKTCGYLLYDYGSGLIKKLHGVPDVPEPSQI
nr:hypothetical protein [Alphaproteobacteria bacterium]